jgi:hypothetical protein
MQTHSPIQANLAVQLVTPPWALDLWPTVFWRANVDRRLKFRHLATRITSAPDRSGRCSGHTLWGRLSDDGDAGLAWDWIEVGRGVVAMADPLRVITNMQLLGVDGSVMPAMDAALHFNCFVRRLPWQEEVRRLLHTA